MRALRFLPLAFVAGQYGFVFFAPYLLMLLALVHMLRRRRARVLARLATAGL